MARAFLTAIDLNKNELQNARVQNLGSAPGTPVTGQLYYNSGDNTLYWYNGSGWVAAKDAGATSVFYQTIRDEGVARAQRNSINFRDTAGNSVTVTDDAGGDESEVTVDTLFAAVTAQTTFGLSSGNGSAATSARSDHTHGTPTHDNAAHSAINLSALAAATANVSLGGFKITNLGIPTTGTDATTKDYVDNAIAGLSWKQPVRAATTANITLSGPQTIDSVSIIANDRVLVKDQTNQTQNGIYVAAAGAWTRGPESDTGAELVGAACWVSEGPTNGNKAFTVTTDAPITIGSTNIVWAQFGGGQAYTAGAGLTGTTTFDVGAGTGITVAADAVSLDTTYTDGRYLRKVAANCAAATTTTVNHAFNTRDVKVEVYRNSTPWDTVDVDVERTDVNNVLVRFAVAPAASAFRIVVEG